MPIRTKVVTTEHIIDKAVTTEKIAALAVIAAKIAAGAVIAEKIGAGAVTTEKLDALAVTAGKIAAEAVIADKIKANVITANKLNLPFHWVDGSWSDGTPSGGYVSWTGITVTYNGATYSIPDGNTNSKYIWWDKDNPTTFQTSSTTPSIDPRDDAIICINLAGKAYPVWQLRQVLGSAIVTDLISADQINVSQLDAISANLGNISAGNLTSVIIQTKTSVPRMRIDSQGIYYQVSISTGKYGNFKYGDGTKYGAGVRAIFCNSNYPSMAVLTEDDKGDIRFFNRTTDPAGPSEIGDLAVVNGILKICTTAGTPGTWTVVGAQS